MLKAMWWSVDRPELSVVDYRRRFNTDPLTPVEI